MAFCLFYFLCQLKQRLELIEVATFISEYLDVYGEDYGRCDG